MHKQIPDYSRESISEALDAAILRAAFLELEEEEMKKIYETMKQEGELQPDCAGFARKLRARTARARVRGIVSYGLPRAMQVAACLIGVLALGAGVALATSAAAREWAAGVLTTGAEQYTLDGSIGWEDDMATYYVGNRAAGGYDSGAALGDTLWLLGNTNRQNVLYAQSATESEPRAYSLQEAQNRQLYRLAAGGGELYGLYIRDAQSDKPSFGVGRICLGEDSYALETVLEFHYEQFTPPEGCEPRSLYASEFLWGDGKLYLALSWEDAQGWTGWGSGWGEGSVELYCADAAGGALTPIPLPEMDWNHMNCVLELFSGPDGAPCLALTTPEGDAVGLWAIQADGSLSALVEIPSQEGSLAARCFACSAGGTLYYLQNGVVYAADGFDVAAAQRSASFAGSAIQGVALGADGYALVNEQRAQIFDLGQAAEIGELRVAGSSNSFAKERFAEKYPEVAIAKGGDWIEYEGDVKKILASDALESDVYLLNEQDVQYFLNAGVYVPLEDETLLEAVSRMNPGVQDFVTRDGQVVALPLWGYTYGDLSFNRQAMEVLGIAPDALPQTWSELLELLAELSHGDTAQACPISRQSDGAEGFASQLMYWMALNYADICDARGQEVDFSRPEFAQLVERFQQIDFAAFRYAADGVTNGPEEAPLLNEMEGGMLLAAGVEALEDTLFLKFDADDPVYTRASGNFAVINPRSRNRELVLEYLRCHLEVADDESELVSLYTQADLEKLSYPLAQQDYQAYVESVGELYFQVPQEREYGELAAQLTRMIGAWLGGQGNLDAVEQTLNAFYAVEA